MDRRLLASFASVAVLVGAGGYAIAQNRSASTQIQATPATLAPAQGATSTTTTAPPDQTTIRSTLPPTPNGEAFDYAAGSGCTPGGNRLPDGEYYGSVIVNDDRSLSFNLKCLFLAADLPPNFDELFAARFPAQDFPNTGFDLIDAASAERRVRLAWNSEVTVDGGLHIGDAAYLAFLARDAVPFDATIVVEENVALTVVEIEPGVSPS